MRIVFCKGGFIGPVSGSDEAVVNYSTHLRLRGHKPQVLLTNKFSLEDQYYLRLRAAGISVRCIVKEPVYQWFRLRRRFGRLHHTDSAIEQFGEWGELAYRTACRYFRRMRPDVVHVFLAESSNSVVIRAAAAVGVPVIYHERATPFYAPEVSNGYECIASVIPLCTAVAALTPVHGEVCRTIYKLNAPALVIPSIVVDPFRGAWVPREQGKEIIFGYAARFETWKGPQVLIESFARIAAKYPTTRLRLAGSGPELETLRDMVHKLGISARCEFVAPYAGSDAKYAFMKGLDVFVHPSFAEGLPNSVMEAMACGLPIIATNVGGVPDMLTPESGIMVPANDVEALASALEHLAGDAVLRKRMGESSRRRYEGLFTPEAVLPLLLSSYERVIHPGRAITAVSHPWAGDSSPDEVRE